MPELKEINFEVIDSNKHKSFMKKKEKERFDKLKQIGCIACKQKGKFSDPVIHHIRKHTGMSLRPSHDDTIPLCPIHHNMGNQSVHLNKKLFESLFGTELELLKETNMEIIKLERMDIFHGGIEE